MIVGLLTQRSLSAFAAVGGWRTVAEAVVSKALFAVAYLLTGQVAASALVAVGGVAVFAVVRVCTGGKIWQAAAGLVVVGVSASLAGSTGQGAAYYLPSVLIAIGAGVVFLVSMLVRWPVIGLVAGRVSGDGLAWRRDRALRRRYQACTALFAAKFAVQALVSMRLYLSDQVVALGIASTLLATPAAALCAYTCGRILRAGATPRYTDAQ
ncbi:DUF3159 domain-containing protein [Spongiactinospora sp. TRM90649]|uniref:DUF3159 domain-containing protein n=1 Tax=Spongiactinospora sp. TRM90649 TaxID=3031114 RepID=UPI0023F82CBF|nr:DUF3159 domain-containing protein [Spongiactinospora sp. TRM90649]MDF5758853.1 DUF3159 domain-containing protein [Spongiactinospora sp. TRM90649]